ncbi:hypothetical protein OG795_15335 [[Kitasatospora] papulosa]|uniref:hypothetical protein n=1 Tax=[Kitasatospora] papulosa TaxID=1464011 RepID=UPI00324D105A
MSYAPHPAAQAAAASTAPADDDQLDDDQLEAEHCTECGRPLKRASADGLGPVCRRNLARAAAAAEQAQQ